ncbi:MAG: indole-3-glycerol phosphate synthase TrpC [Gammaproteobacteria bacterium]
MENLLRRIVADKRAEVRRRRDKISLSEIQKNAAAAPPPRDFTAALRGARKNGRFPAIAEIKYKSPSRGVLRADFDPAALARSYEDGGAACISVLTDAPYFGGDDSHLRRARDACALPALRKDFIAEEWQIYESRVLGADAVLLLAAALSAAEMRYLAKIAATLGMAVLAESHDESELRAALRTPDAWIGINNRDLGDFRVSLQTSLDLLPLAAGRATVAESGIASAADVALLSRAGADAFLIGETLMRAENPAAALQELFAPE